MGKELLRLLEVMAQKLGVQYGTVTFHFSDGHLTHTRSERTFKPADLSDLFSNGTGISTPQQ